MKKLIPALLAILLSICLSVPSLAYYTGSIPGMTREGNDVRIKTIITSTLTEKEKDFMRSWFAGGGTGKKTLLIYETLNIQSELVFSLVPNDCDLVRMTDGSPGTKRFQFTKQISSMYFRYDNASKTYKLRYFGENSNSVTVPTARISGGFNHNLLDPEFQLDYDGVCLIDDDGGLEDGSSSSAPEPPAPSEPPAPPYDPAPAPPMPPSGGSNSPYIPYDPNVWWEAVSFIRSGAGAAGNILFLILAPIVLVGMAFFFIRHYSSGGKGGGGGGTAI